MFYLSFVIFSKPFLGSFSDQAIQKTIQKCFISFSTNFEDDYDNKCISNGV